MHYPLMFSTFLTEYLTGDLTLVRQHLSAGKEISLSYLIAYLKHMKENSPNFRDVFVTTVP